MRTIVTVVLVAQRGGEWLQQTLEGLADQNRPPERIIGVNNGSRPEVSEQLAAGGASSVVSIEQRLAFGAAVQQALAVIPHGIPTPPGPAEGPRSSEAVTEWVWLLSEDTCPDPKALARIVRTVERAPSVAVAGPKLVDWDRPSHIIELGQSLTHYGSRWKLRRQELDQQQYDHLQDVMGVGPAGMLVRRDVWDQLGGFDPALPVVDDGLDFSVRARLAGHRVVVAPLSRVRYAQAGIAGPRIERRRSVMRAAHREDRAAQTHRRIAYAPAFVAFFMWLGLPLYAVGRVLWSLIREQPGQMIGEFRAAMRVFFHPGRIIASRRRIARHSAAGWPAVLPLRVDAKTVRTAKLIDREAILASQGITRREIHFISTGGLAVLITATVLSAAMCWWALGQSSLTGGALAPLSPIDELWRNTRSLDGVPADPFTWVLALLGTLTFWNPSHAVVLLYVTAIPLAALGGWTWAAQLTESKAGRALLGLGWALSPVLLGSLASGRLPTLILAVVLPWLLIAATRCRESWSWAGFASILAAIALACAPILIPVAIVLLIVGMATSVRGMARVLTTALAPIIVFAPKAVYAIINGKPLHLFLDPGITPVYEPGTTWHLMLGFPEFGLEGWGVIFEDIGLGGPPATLLVGVLMLAIAMLAVLGIFTARVPVSLLNALIGGLGLITAIAATSLHIVQVGSETVPLWTGSGLALFWIAVLALAAVGTDVLRNGAVPVVSVALVAALIAVAPLTVKLVSANTGLQPGDTQMPAIVQAAGEADPDVRTLVITATGPEEVRAELVRGSGLRLDEIRTATRDPETTDRDDELAELVGSLASIGDSELSADLEGLGVGFVLLRHEGYSAERAELQSVFDQHAVLSSAGQTEHGLLWRGDTDSASGAAAELDGSDDAAAIESETAERSAFVDTVQKIGTSTLWWVQVIVLLGIVLLALPTGEVVERPQRRKRPAKKWRKDAAAPGDAVGETEPPEATAEVTEAEAAGTESAEGPTEPSMTEADVTDGAEAGDAVDDPEPGASTDSDTETDATDRTDSTGGDR